MSDDDAANDELRIVDLASGALQARSPTATCLAAPTLLRARWSRWGSRSWQRRGLWMRLSEGAA